MKGGAQKAFAISTGARPRAHGLRRAGQRGATVLIALVTVAVVAALASALIVRQDDWYRQVSLQTDRAHAQMLARAGVRYAMAVLADDARVGAVDHHREVWARPLPPTTAEGGLLAGRIVDLQGRINLNDAAGLTEDFNSWDLALVRLFEDLGIPTDRLVALADWIDADDQPRSGGAEDAYYLSLRKPYRAANRELTSVDELRYVRGFDAGIIERLRPHVAALPRGTAINLNTASTTVLRALVPTLSESQAEALRASGDLRPFTRVDDFVGRAGAIDAVIPGAGHWSVASRWFEIVGDVRWGSAFSRLQVIVERRDAGAMPRIAWTRAS